ncbi:MAG: C10 family peptidase [Phycisphaerae bacterium]|nr:C10 family peptidase [Phycisphaerae bacterium]
MRAQKRLRGLRTWILPGVAIWLFLASAVVAEPVDQATTANVAARFARRKHSQWRKYVSSERAPAHVKARAGQAEADGAPGTKSVTPLVDPETGEVIGRVIALDPIGYIVTAADSDLSPVIAFSLTSNFSFEECNENILLYMVRADLKARLAGRATVAVELRTNHRRSWAALAADGGGDLAADPPAEGDGDAPPEPEGGSQIWGPLLDTQWSQGDPYNRFCPNDPISGFKCATGCPATAMAQVVNYWMYPNYVEFDGGPNTPGYVGDSYWSIRKPPPNYEPHEMWIDADLADCPFISYTGDPDNPNHPSTEIIGRLMFACGVAIKVVYSDKGSGGMVSEGGYQKLGARYEMIDPNYVTFEECLMAGWPANCGITQPIPDGEGHAIVCDGYWQSDNPAIVPHMYHLNFGWAGNTDGWYAPSGMPFPWVWGGSGTCYIPLPSEVLAINDATAREGIPFTGPTPVIDPSTVSRPCKWTLLGGPTGMTINQTTGVVQWSNPTALNDVYTVTIRAKNEAGQDSTSFDVTVVACEPNIATIAPATISSAVAYHSPAPTLIHGSAPITWSLPDPNNTAAGMTIDPGTGQIEWLSPDPNGSPHRVTVRAQNVAGADEESYLLTVLAPPTIEPVADASACTVGTYELQPTLLAGSPPVTWSLADPNDPNVAVAAGDANYVPPGLGIDPNTGLVTWTDPDPNGAPYRAAVRAANAVGAAGVAWEIDVIVAPSVGSITDKTIEAGVAYAETPLLLQGATPITWSFADPNDPNVAVDASDANFVPAGMSIDPGTGEVNWANPAITADGSPYLLAIQAANACRAVGVAWTVDVEAVPVIDEIADHEVTVGQSYSLTPTVSAGSLPLTWSKVAGPAGLNVNSTTGEVTWTNPAPTCSTHTVTIKVTNSAGQDTETYVLSVIPPAGPTVIADVPDAEIQDSGTYSVTPVLAQGSLPVTWDFEDANSIPSGMGIDPNTGQVTWSSPTTVGSPFTITIVATGPSGTDDESWVLTVTATPHAPIITEIEDHGVIVGALYTGPTPILEQGTLPVSWSFQNPGSVPTGMQINPSTGVVTWPSASMTGSPHTITIVATNTIGTDTESWLLTVSPVPLAPKINEIPNRAITAGQPYAEMPTLLQGTAPVTWSFKDPNTASLGLEVDPNTGAVSWADPAGGAYTISVVATNTAGNDIEVWSLQVNAQVIAPEITGLGPVGTATEGTPYAGPTPVVTGTAPFSWSVAVGPSGMTIDPNGVVTWPNPSTIGSPRRVVIRATNDAGSDDREFFVPVTPAPAPPQIGTIADATITAGQSYTSPAPSVTGEAPILWSFADPPAIPAGMEINETTGVVTWPSPTTAGSPFTVTVRAENTAGTDEESYTLTVTPQPVAPVIGAMANETVLAGQPYTSSTPTATGTGPLTWTLSSQNIGQGMQIDPGTGRVHWPSSDISVSPVTITIHVTGPGGSDNASWQLTVTQAPDPPVINPIGNGVVTVGQTYMGPVPSLSQGATGVTWSLVAGPGGMTIDSKTGVVTWVNTAGAGVTYTIKIRATNLGGTDDERWDLTVNPVTAGVTIGVAPADVGLTFTVDGQAHTGVVNFNWQLGTSHQVSVQGTQVGSNGITYEYESWSDGHASPTRTIVAAASADYTVEMRKIVPGALNIIGPVSVPENGAATYRAELTMTDNQTEDMSTEATWRLSSTDCAAIKDGKLTALEVDSDMYCEVYATCEAHGRTMTARLPITILDVGKTYALSVSSSPTGSGSPARSTYAEGKVVEIPVPDPPEEGMIFVGWSGDASGTDDPLRLTMNGDKDVTAVFQKADQVVPTAGFCGSAPLLAVLVGVVSLIRGRRRRIR